MTISLKEKLKNNKFRGLFGLYTGRIMLSISSGLLGIFLPIFFYNTFGQNLQYLILFYLVSSFSYGALAPLGAQFLNKFGFKRALVLATIWGGLFYTTLFFIKEGSDNLIYLITIAFLSLLFFRLFFWIPYHVDFAKFTDKNKRGKQLSVLFSAFTIISAIGPIIAGYLIKNFGFNILFIIIIIIFMLAIIPLLMVPKTNEKFTWGYFETWKNVFGKKNRHVTMSLMATGAENAIGVIIWPIFIFLLLDGDYLKVGAISSFIVIGTVILQLVTGKYLDKMQEKSKMLKLGSILYSVGWVIKIFVVTSFSIFIAGLYHSITGILTKTSINTMFYELAADEGHYVDEFTVFREISIQVGRVVVLIAVLIASFFVAIQWTFIFAAIASILFNALYLNKYNKL